MSYIINTYNGKKLTVVSEGSVDYTTDLVLPGKNYSGYGESQNQNFIFLLENFARGSSPDKPVTGQMWFDSFTNKLKFYDNNNVWRTASGADVLDTKPDYLTDGDFWFDKENNQLYVYSSTGSSSGAAGYVLIGPPNSKTSGKLTAMRSVVVYDTDSQPHQILEALIEDKVTFTISYDDEFTLNDISAIEDFTNIYPGITLAGVNSEVLPVGTNNFKVHGTSTSSDSLVVDVIVESVPIPTPVFGSIAVPTTESKLSVAVRSSDGTIYTSKIDVDTAVSGAGFTSFLASPPPIGTVVPSQVVGTSIKAIGSSTQETANLSGIMMDYVVESTVGTGVLSIGDTDVLKICPRTAEGALDLSNPYFVVNSSGALGVGITADYGDDNEVLVSKGPNQPPQWLPISGGTGGGGTFDYLYTTIPMVATPTTPGMIVDYDNGGRIFVTENQSITIYRNNAGNPQTSIKIDGDGKVGIKDDSPQVSLSINGTDAIKIPAGTDAQKPMAIQGYFRFNTDKKYFEGADGVNWTSFGVIPGTIIAYIGSEVPAGYLKCPPTPTFVSKTAYASLYSVIGTTWGSANGGAEFGLPVFPEGYTVIAGTPGTSSVGQVISHTHTYSKAVQGGQKPLSTGTKPFDKYADALTEATGGSANLAAGVKVMMCIKF